MIYTPLDLWFDCPRCQVAWRGDVPCWSCHRMGEPCSRPTMANQAGPSPASVGVALIL